MLDVTLSTAFHPGANVKGRISGANWVFLRPAVPAERVVCLGAPTAPTLATLAAVSDSVLVLAHSNHQMRRNRAVTRHPAGNVRFCLARDTAGMPLADRTVDVLVIQGWRSGRRLRRDPKLREELRRALKPDACVYYEYFGTLDPFRHLPLLNGGAGAPGGRRFWLTPWRGELQSAVPLEDSPMAAYFRDHRLTGSSFTGRLQRAATCAHGWFAPAPARMPGIGAPPQEPSGPSNGRDGLDDAVRHRCPLPSSRHRRPSWLARWVERHGVLRGLSAPALDRHPPQYLSAIAAAFGIELADLRWGFSARGDYGSRKLLFYFAEAQAGAALTPRYVAKMVREPRFNARLENEYRALSLVDRRGAVDAGTVPRAVFFGHHGGLAIIGESAIDGVPFAQATDATVGCRYLHATVDWLIGLAAATAEPLRRPGEISPFMWLLGQFSDIYHTTTDEQQFLSAQIARLLEHGDALPTTFQHGDPGTWNILATPAGGVALLDWEAAEPRGVPLWDLLYFLRSYAIGAARRAGTRRSLDGFTQQFLSDTPMHRMAADATGRYCRRVGVPDDLIGPLFYSCWMHRAIKEATRLPAERLDNGHYINLLRLAIAKRAAPALSGWLGRGAAR